MPIGSDFLTAASPYLRSPGADIKAAKVEATKQASYLSSMDQFYAELAEMERQFDLTLGFKEKGLELEESRFGLEEEKFEFTKETTEEASELEWYKARTGRIGEEAKEDYYSGVLSQGEEELDIKRLATESEIYKSEQEEDFAYKLLPTPGPQFEQSDGTRTQSILPLGTSKPRGYRDYTGYL